MDIADIDTLGVKQALELFPDQIKESYNQAMAHPLSVISPVNGVVISGMGGSSNAAKILEGVYEEDFSTPVDIDIHNDYGLPSWVNRESLVIANSYSGNTEETLSGYEEAKKRGAKVIGISTGGKIQDVVVSPGKTNPTGFPKTGLGVSIGALLGVLSKVGVLKVQETELTSAVNELTEIRKTWDVEKKAAWINGYMPVLFSGRPLIGALNAGRNAMCEISRNFTQFYDFPEVNHVLVEATGQPAAAREKVRYLFFVSKFNHPRVLERYKITKEIFDEQGLSHDDYELKGSTKLTQALELAHYCAWVAYHLSILQGADPGPEPWIAKLKDKLSQPVH
jgi:glucose/mannose-6-phosphate isomerase